MNLKVSFLTSDKSVYDIAYKRDCNDNHEANYEGNVVESDISVELLVFTHTTWPYFEMIGASLFTEIVITHMPARWTAWNANSLSVKHSGRAHGETLFNTIKIL